MRWPRAGHPLITKDEGNQVMEANWPQEAGRNLWPGNTCSEAEGRMGNSPSAQLFGRVWSRQACWSEGGCRPRLLRRGQLPGPLAEGPHQTLQCRSVPRSEPPPGPAAPSCHSPRLSLQKEESLLPFVILHPGISSSPCCQGQALSTSCPHRSGRWFQIQCGQWEEHGLRNQSQVKVKESTFSPLLAR